MAAPPHVPGRRGKVARSKRAERVWSAKRRGSQPPVLNRSGSPGFHGRSAGIPSLAESSDWTQEKAAEYAKRSQGGWWRRGPEQGKGSSCLPPYRTGTTYQGPGQAEPPMPLSFGPRHLTRVPFVIHASEVEQTMEHQDPQFIDAAMSEFE